MLSSSSSSRWSYSRWFAVPVILQVKLTAIGGVNFYMAWIFLTHIMLFLSVLPMPLHFPSLFCHRAAANTSCQPMLSCFPSAHHRGPRITQTIQTHWLYLIKGEWPVLSNSSSASLVVETNIEMAQRAFREGALEYVLVMIMTMLLMLLSVHSKAAAPSLFL